MYLIIKFMNNTKLDILPKYASCCVGSNVEGNIVGMPGINVLSFSLPPQRDLFFLFLPSTRNKQASITHYISRIY